MKPQFYNLSSYIETLQKKGRYTFTREEAINTNNLTAISFKRSIQRLLARKRVVRPVREFYVIVPIEYQGIGSPPPSWFIDDLMQFFKHPYYVALLSAAALHGAAHQQPQEFQVMTDIPIRPIRIGNTQITFLKKMTVNQTITESVKTPTGYIKISTPEVTALDLACYFKASGYFSHVATVLSELCEKINGPLLLEAAKEKFPLSSIQRLGYLIEYVTKDDKVTQLLHDWLKEQHPRYVTLLPEKSINPIDKNSRWKLYINEIVEIDE